MNTPDNRTRHIPEILIGLLLIAIVLGVGAQLLYSSPISEGPDDAPGVRVEVHSPLSAVDSLLKEIQAHEAQERVCEEVLREAMRQGARRVNPWVSEAEVDFLLREVFLHARTESLSPLEMWAIIAVESGFRDVISSRGEVGYMQIRPEVWTEIPRHEIRQQNVQWGARILSLLKKRDPVRYVANYNGSRGYAYEGKVWRMYKFFLSLVKRRCE